VIANLDEPMPANPPEIGVVGTCMLSDGTDGECFWAWT